ncbi:MAG: efflux RND transporter permease subunit [Acidobacteria bacterium]|nr:efflux RND transporter permease subunit [Acidobacteriota bacterium]
MLNSIIEFSLQQRFLVIALTLLLAGAGLFALSSLPIDSYPDLTNNQVNIFTEAPGTAATEVEQLITYPIESAMLGLRRTEEVRSISKFGISVVTIVFEDGVDSYFARQLVNERLQEARGRLPQEVDPVLGPLATPFGEISHYVLEGKGYDAMQLRSLQDWVVKPQLRTIPGVNDVSGWGGFIRQYQVIANPERLLAYQLTLQDVYEALASSNQNFGGSYLERGAEGFTVLGQGRFNAANAESDIGSVVVKARAGTPVLIRDVAEIKIGAAMRQGSVSKDGQGEVVSGMVIMSKGESSKDTIEKVHERYRQIEKSLPAGVKITPFYEQTDLINRTTKTLATNLIEGGLLVIVVLFLFLFNVRASLIVASVIPLSMLIAFIGMKAFGLTANLMSLGALDFGLIVDGAVVMIEGFVTALGVQSVAHDRKERLRLSALDIARPIVFGIVIIIAVYLPLFALQGLESRMFRPMALTVCCALVGSLLLTLTFVPAMGSLLLKPHGEGVHERFMQGLQNAYRRGLERAARMRWLTVATALLLVVGAFAVLARLGTEFMPKLDEGQFLIETRRLPSVSLTQATEISGMVEKALLEFPEVTSVITKLGRPDIATDTMGVYQGDVYVKLKPIEQWRSATTREGLIEAFDKKLQNVPGVGYNFTQPLEMRMDEVISGVRADVAVKLFGDDTAVLEREGERIARVLQRVAGAADVQVEALSGAGELQIQINRAALARYGLHTDDVARTVEMALGGAVATELIDERKRTDIVVRLPESYRANDAALGSILLPAPNGERVTLAQLASIKTALGPEVVNRENAQRRIVIQSNVRGRDIGSFVADAQAAFDREVKLPTGYFVTWGGEFENQQRAMKRLYLVVPLALFLIFMLLFASFGTLRHALLIILNVPFALVGGVAALWLRGLPLSLSAAIGFIALFGVAVLNGVVMVSYINRLRDDGLSLSEAVLTGAAGRLRPVLMTALVASLGFIPMALSSAPGAEVQRPLATVVIGGLITATLLTMFVLPLLYEWIERFQQRTVAVSDSEA